MQRGTPCRVLSSNQGVVSGQICSDLAMSAPPAKEGQLGSQDDGRTDGPNRPGRECRELAWFFFFFLLSGARSRKEKGRVGGKWKCEKPGNPTTVEQNPLSSLVCGKLIAVSSVSSERAPSVRQTRPQRFACFFFFCVQYAVPTRLSAWGLPVVRARVDGPWDSFTLGPCGLSAEQRLSAHSSRFSWPSKI